MQVSGSVNSKKRRADVGLVPSVHDSAFPEVIQKVVAKSVRGPTEFDPAGVCTEDMRSLRAEIKEIKEGQLRITQLIHTVVEGLQAQANSRANAVLQKSITLEMPTSTSRQETEGSRPPTWKWYISA
jgi:hypothetical protein